MFPWRQSYPFHSLSRTRKALNNAFPCCRAGMGRRRDLFWTGRYFPDNCDFHKSEEIFDYDRTTDAPTTLTLLNALTGAAVIYCRIRILEVSVSSCPSTILSTSPRTRRTTPSSKSSTKKHLAPAGTRVRQHASASRVRMTGRSPSSAPMMARRLPRCA
ncbi:protein of unknown function [Agrobacterium pusense]|uniref:Uncharacterized protein n=1 Tax=Agrobacterium pusense TaxID=648995 RepID=U4Q663_9HYPH|nr:protein of unknown function [Agrobacterium pusense]